jgi:hypothetical protein
VKTLVEENVSKETGENLEMPGQLYHMNATQNDQEGKYRIVHEGTGCEGSASRPDLSRPPPHSRVKSPLFPSRRRQGGPRISST